MNWAQFVISHFIPYFIVIQKLSPEVGQLQMRKVGLKAITLLAHAHTAIP